MKYEFTKLGEMTKSCEITNCRKLSAISHWASLHSETKGREFFFVCVRFDMHGTLLSERLCRPKGNLAEVFRSVTNS